MAKPKVKPEPIARLNKHDLDIAIFTSKDDARPILQHILVRKTKPTEKGQAGSVELVATDSYRAMLYKAQLALGTVRSPQPPAEVFKELRKLVGKRTVSETNKVRKLRGKGPYTRRDDVELYPDRAEIPGLKIVMKFEQPEAPFPDLDKLIKDKIVRKDYAADLTLSGRYLSDIIKFVQADPMNGYDGVTIRHNGKLEPFEVFRGNSYGILMPLKA